MRKMLLYVERFALSPLRVQVIAFLLFLALAWLILLLRLFIERLPAFAMTAVCAAVVLLSLLFGVTDANIVRYNTAYYPKTEHLSADYSDLAQSDDAIPALVEVARTAEDKDIKWAALCALASTYGERYGAFTFYFGEDGAVTAVKGGEGFEIDEHELWAYSRNARAARAALENFEDEFVEMIQPDKALDSVDRANLDEIYVQLNRRCDEEFSVDPVVSDPIIPA
jgi:hypothetical protein